jgi:AcrR family transcriptional regulator
MKRPNRQVERTHRLLLEAMQRLLREQGPDAVTHLRVAEEAGVARATVYRHWPERIDMLAAALASGIALPNWEVSPDRPVRDRIGEALKMIAAPLNNDIGSVVMLLGRAEWDEHFQAAKAAMIQSGPGRFVELLSQAVPSGELNADLDPQVLAERLLGPVLARRLIFGEIVTDDYVDRLVNSVFPG